MSEQNSLAEQAYQMIRSQIVRLTLAPGDVLREDVLQEQLRIGRTPIREALQRLAREHFVNIIPRRGMIVAGIEVEELALLFETRTVLEPYAARLAAARGNKTHWEEMARAIALSASADNEELMAIDHRCHELMWLAAGNRFLIDTLDVLYAQSDRLWHLYLSDVADMNDAVDEHRDLLSALRSGDGERSAKLMEAHVRAFDSQIRQAVTARLAAPLTS
ncbi:MAG: GntR family transcriptional regulator [Acidimicrobiales bacterium]|nr:GntR family transcriptional regulator [Acidimicrobiales bacterium]